MGVANFNLSYCQQTHLTKSYTLSPYQNHYRAMDPHPLGSLRLTVFKTGVVNQTLSPINHTLDQAARKLVEEVTY